MVRYLCQLARVSRSGYYRYFSDEVEAKRQTRHQADESVKDIILKAFHFRCRPKSARQVKMTLKHQYQITYNLKRIRRIKKLISFVQFAKQILIEEWQKQQRNIGHYRTF